MGDFSVFCIAKAAKNWGFTLLKPEKCVNSMVNIFLYIGMYRNQVSLLLTEELVK